MSLKESLVPNNTEEIKPGLFVQRRAKDKYRVVNPIVWKGKWRLKQQFGWGNLLMIILIVGISWSYFTETEFCRQLQEDPCELLPNITNYCYEQNSIGIINYEEGKYNYTIQDYP